MQTAPIEPVASLALVAPTNPSPFDREAPTERMYLTSRVQSTTAESAIAALEANIIELQGNRTKASESYLVALGAMVAELLRAASHDPPRGCFRSLRSGDFTGIGVGYQPFRRALDDMERHGYATLDEGEPWWKSAAREGKVTRIFVTPRLTDFMACNGITVADRYRHFKYQRAMHDVPPIQLRAASTRKWPHVVRGRKMRVDYTNPTVTHYADQIRQINHYLCQHSIIGPGGEKMDIALYRSFNLGDQPGHDYKKGGRVYATYQSIARDKRSSITINGQPTVEVDISTCFLTLLHYFLNKPFSNVSDPYAGPSHHRAIVKAWVNLTIGYSDYHSRWPKKILKKLAKKGHFDVPKRFPIQSIKDEILTYIPIVREWVDSEYTWADLFMLESQIMIDAVICLIKDHDVPAMLLHDAIRIPDVKAALVKGVIQDSFLKHTGIIPIVG